MSAAVTNPSTHGGDTGPAPSDGPSTRWSAVLSRYGDDTSGATSIEYALVTGLIVLAIIVALQTYAASVEGVYRSIETAVFNK